MENLIVIFIILLAAVTIIYQVRKSFKYGSCSSCSEGCSPCSSCTSSNLQCIDLGKSSGKGEKGHE